MSKLYFRLVLAVSIAFIVSMLVVPHKGYSCAAIGPEPVMIADESAVIVWNKTTHTEHFIRTASFDTASRSFGFVVPTPTIPHLSTANPEAISNLDDTMMPKVLRGYDRRIKLWSIFNDMDQAQSKLAYVGNTIDGDDVEVLGQQHVDGIDATTLLASNTVALGLWMKKHGFHWSADQSNWLSPYVKQHWMITVFKFAKGDKKKAHVTSNLLDMTFTADRPFFPYSEPASQRAAGDYSPFRLLRIYLLSDSRMAGVLGANSSNQTWPGAITYTAPLMSSKVIQLAPLLKLNVRDMPVETWLTTYEDYSSPRPGVADVYFQRDSDQSTIEPDPVDLRIKRYKYIPVELIGAAWLALLFAGRRLTAKSSLRSAWTSVLKISWIFAGAYYGCFAVILMTRQPMLALGSVAIFFAVLIYVAMKKSPAE